jgi:DNA-binding FadR family transcriptional regulator
MRVRTSDGTPIAAKAVWQAESRDAILAGEILEGSRPPNERDPAERFGVARPTIREALRSLEAFGIVEIRPGRAGGAMPPGRPRPRSAPRSRHS